MNKYRVIAENTGGTAGESPLIYAASPEDAEKTYHDMGGTFVVISIEVEE